MCGKRWVSDLNCSAQSGRNGFGMRNRDGGILFGYAPVICAMAIVVDSFVGHLCCYFTLCGIVAT